MKRLFCRWLLVLAALTVASGSSCPGLRGPRVSTPPVFATRPSLEQLIQYYNSTTGRVRQLQTTGATLSSQQLLLSLSANIALERPRRFRLQAGFTGPEIDIGSNDDVFWFWARRSEPPAIYFCRHDQFQYSAARQVMPVQPEWIAEAMGLLYFDPTLRHDGPYPRGSNQLEIRTIVPGPDGNLTKVTVVDAVHAWVMQQQIFDPQGQLLASAVASQHQYDPINQISLPRQIDIQLPSAQLSFTINVADYLINQINSNPQQLWALPHIDGYPLVDLCNPSAQPYNPPATAPQNYPVPYPAAPVNAPPPYSADASSPYGTYPRRW